MFSISSSSALAFSTSVSGASTQQVDSKVAMAAVSPAVSWSVSSLLAELRNSATELRSRSAARRAAAAGLFNSWASPAESLPSAAKRSRCCSLAQRGQAITLLLASRGFARPVHHGCHQAAAQFRQVAQQIVELGSRQYENSRCLHRPAGAGEHFHARVWQHTGNGSSMGGKHVLVYSLKSRLQLAFQDHNHFVRNVPSANINLAGLHADLGRMFEEPVQLLVRKIVEDLHSTKLFSGDVRHWVHIRHITGDELHGNCSLAYRRGNTLDGSVPYVAHYKHARHAALQQKRIAVELPLRRKLSVL